MSAPSTQADTPQELCPWNERRLPREMYVKFFVVNFVAIGAFAQLMHLRRERRQLATYLLMFGLPFTGSALVIGPLIVMIVQIAVCRGNFKMVGQSLAILIGRLPDVKDDAYDEDSEGCFAWPPKMSRAMVRGLVVQAAVLSQSVMSIWLFARRVRHGSDALYDHRILQLAILGFCASLMSIIHLLSQPRYPSKDNMGTISKRVRWLRVLRPIAAPKSRGLKVPDLELWDPKMMFSYWFFACIASPPTELIGLRLQVIELFQAEWNVWRGFIDWHHAISFCILVFEIFASLFFLKNMRVNSAKDIATIALSATVLGYLAPILLFFWFIIYGFLTSPGAIAVMQFRFLFSWPINPKGYSESVDSKEPSFTPNWDRIWTYGHASSAYHCPTAWKDPAADHVWWLA